MSKHKGEHHGNAAVLDEQESVQNEVIAEEPKTKVGNKEETTTIDGATAEPKEKKPRAAKIKGTERYRILAGVDAQKFAGQRGCVVRSLQKLASEQGEENSFTLAEIVANVEGLQSKTPVEASVAYHLKGMVTDLVVEKIDDAPVAA